MKTLSLTLLAATVAAPVALVSVGTAPAMAQDVVDPATAEVIEGAPANFTGTVHVRMMTKPAAPGQAGQGQFGRDNA